MHDASLLLIAAVFLLAGSVKGVIGLGLPTLAMGLLALFMSPLEAAALMAGPSFATNIWQMLAGPAFGRVVRRLWPMMLAICLGAWLGAGAMSGALAARGVGYLGIALALYGLVGLRTARIALPAAWEPVAGPAAGLATGLATAATGVAVMPAAPYLQSLGLERDELAQALGLSFTVSTAALGLDVIAQGGMAADGSFGRAATVALAASGAGMMLGQKLRARISPAWFRRGFFASLVLLGLYQATRAFA